jgi:soluble lytic murein transglycosylase-like protein
MAGGGTVSPALAGLPPWTPVALAGAAVLAWSTRRRLAALVLAGAFLTVLGALPMLSGGQVGGDLAPGAAVPASLRPAIVAAGHRCTDVTASTLAAQLWQESRFDPNSRSAAGALGIAQFLPATWARYGVDGDHDGRADPFDPLDGIASQANYMCQLAADMRGARAAGRVHGSLIPLTLAAYNAGPGAVVRAGGVPSFAETTNYVAVITAKARTFTATT